MTYYPILCPKCGAWVTFTFVDENGQHWICRSCGCIGESQTYTYGTTTTDPKKRRRTNKMITIDEAISQCYRIIHNKTIEAETLKDDYEIFAKDCLDDAEVHKQLAKWLKELKTVHAVIDDMEDHMGVCVGYLKDKMKEA